MRRTTIPYRLALSIALALELVSGIAAAKSVTLLPTAKPAASALFNAACHRTGSDWEQAIFVCDGIDGDRIKVVTTPNARGLSELWTYQKRGFSASHETVRLGDEDPGAGQIMRELQQPGGVAIGSVHSINPGIVGDARATTLPRLSSITVRRETTRCRWMPRGRVLFIDARRTVLVTSEIAGGFTYWSFDYAKPGRTAHGGGGSLNSTATTIIRRGHMASAKPGHETYVFAVGPWTYRLEASADNRAPGARLTVLHLGKPATSSNATAYQMAAKRIE